MFWAWMISEYRMSGGVLMAEVESDYEGDRG